MNPEAAGLMDQARPIRINQWGYSFAEEYNQSQAESR